MQLAAHEYGNGDQAADPLRMQAVVFDAAGRIVLEGVHILDHVDLFLLVPEYIHPHRNDINGNVLKVSDLRRDTVLADLIGVVRKIFLPIKLKDIRPVCIIMLDDHAQHGVNRGFKVVEHHKRLDTDNELSLRRQIHPRCVQVGHIAVDVDGDLHPAFPACVLDEAIMQQHIAECGVLAHPGVALPRAARQQVIRAELAGKRLVLQVLITLRTRFRFSQAGASAAVQIQKLIRFQVADVDDLINLIEDLWNLHTFFSLFLLDL